MDQPRNEDRGTAPADKPEDNLETTNKPVPAPVPGNNAADSPAANSATRPNPDGQGPVGSGPRRNNTALVAVIMALVVALGLGGIGYMAYAKSKQAVQPDTKAAAPAPQPPAPESTEVKADDVQKAADDIDSSLKTLDDNKDFGENDLSDTTLGIQ